MRRRKLGDEGIRGNRIRGNYGLGELGSKGVGFKV